MEKKLLLLKLYLFGKIDGNHGYTNFESYYNHVINYGFYYFFLNKQLYFQPKICWNIPNTPMKINNIELLIETIKHLFPKQPIDYK